MYHDLKAEYLEVDMIIQFIKREKLTELILNEKETLVRLETEVVT
jgi:hypothetical protein